MKQKISGLNHKTKETDRDRSSDLVVKIEIIAETMEEFGPHENVAPQKLRGSAFAFPPGFLIEEPVISSWLSSLPFS